jgi:hypothetical protein
VHEIVPVFGANLEPLAKTPHSLLELFRESGLSHHFDERVLTDVVRQSVKQRGSLNLVESGDGGEHVPEHAL